jgi:hypothetical protein
MRNFLRLNSNLIIFLDKDNDIETYNFIIECRKSCLERTHIISLKIEEWEMYKHYKYWLYCHQIDIEKGRHSPELYMLWNEKTYFVEKAIEKNPFESKWFFWTDIGCCRNKNDISKIINYPNIFKLLDLELNTNKMLLSYIEPLQESDILLDDNGIPLIFNNKSSTQSCDNIIRVQGGFFGGNIDCWKRWTQLYTNTIELFIKNNVFGGKDQYIMATIDIKYQEDIQSYQSIDKFGDIWFYFLNLLS